MKKHTKKMIGAGMYEYRDFYIVAVLEHPYGKVTGYLVRTTLGKDGHVKGLGHIRLLKEAVIAIDKLAGK